MVNSLDSKPLRKGLESRLHGEVLHTNDTLIYMVKTSSTYKMITLICMVKFYIQMILSHLHSEFARLEPKKRLRGERVIFNF